MSRPIDWAICRLKMENEIFESRLKQYELLYII